MKPMLPGFLILLASLAIGVSHADTIYSETFENTGTADLAIGEYNWSAYRNNGTNYTNGPVSGAVGNELVEVNQNDFVLIASSSTQFSTHFALLSSAGTIDPADYDNDLTISFTENATDESTASPEMGWRVLAQVGSTIYASDFIPFTAAPAITPRDIIVSDSVWHEWSGETDLSDGFEITAISGTAGNLPAGAISGLGVLAIDGAQSNDRMRLFDFSITGTSTSSPPAASLGITSFTSVGGGVWEAMLKGSPNTTCEFHSSTTLDFTPGILLENLTQGDPGDPGTIGGPNDSQVTTDGAGDAKVRFMLTGDPADFVRARSVP